MALSNTAGDTAPSDSSGLAKGKGGSPISSGGTASKSVAPRDTRWGASVKRRPMNLELHQFPKATVREGAKETTTHDFLSLYKNAAVTGKIEKGIHSPSITQDLLQPLEKCAQSIGGNIATAGFLTPNGHMNNYRATNQNCYGGVQGAGHGHSHETRELPTKSMWMDGLERGLKGVKEDNHAHGSTSHLKFGTRELGYVAKTGPTHSHLEVGQQHTSSPIQEWEHGGSGFCNMVKEPHIVTPKGTKDEEYSDFDDESEKKEVLIQKGDAVQKMDGKNNDCKTNTPRSKHSATEQRRRSKINDRFQMLRQLVPNTDQKRDKASFLLEVIEYIQVLQEKLNKCEATEHGRQQERLKTITWELPQRNSGLQDFTPIVSTVPSDWKKGTDNQLGRPKSTSVVAAGEYGSIGDISLPVDRSIEESHYGHPNHEKVAISMSTPVSLSGQHPVNLPFGRDSNLPNISVLRSVTESHVSSYPRLDGEILVPPSINKVETLLPVPYKNSPAPAQLIWGMDEKWQHELENKTYGFSQQDMNQETCNKDSANGKGNSGQESEPPVAGPFIGLLQNRDAYVSKHNGGVKTTIMHRPETPQRGVTSASPQEPVIIQGDNVNVSSVYSQKLLDTLKKEFQCSGFDLSKTSISVQINLGKVANQSTEIQQQSAGHGKHPAPQAWEGLNKRPKIVSES